MALEGLKFTNELSVPISPNQDIKICFIAPLSGNKMATVFIPTFMNKGTYLTAFKMVRQADAQILKDTQKCYQFGVH